MINDLGTDVAASYEADQAGAAVESADPEQPAASQKDNALAMETASVQAEVRLVTPLYTFASGTCYSCTLQRL